MAVVGELVVLITGSHIPLLGSLAKSEAAMTSFGARAGVLLVGLGAAAAVIGVKAIESAAKFEDAMMLIETQAGGSRAEVEAMTTAILKLAPSVATGPQELAEALYRIESTGHRGADALDLLTTSAQLAKIGHADLEDTTNALLAAMNSGVGGFTSSAQAAGILNSIIGSGNLRMEDLNAAIGTGFLSKAATFGVSLQSIGASLATMTAAGQPAEISATRLGMSMNLLGAPSAKATKMLATVGLGQYDLAAAMRGPDGVLGAIVMLNEHLSGLDPTHKAAFLSQAFGGGRSSGAIMSLIELLGEFPIIQQSVIDGAANLDAAWERTSQDASFRWEQVGVSIDVVVKAIGLALLPAVENLLGAVVPVVSAFAQWATDNPGLASNILLIAGAVGALAVAAAVLGPVFALAGTVIALALNPVAIIIAGLLASIASIMAFADKNNALAAQGMTPEEIAAEKFNTGSIAYQQAATKHGYGQPAWGTFGTPGFGAGDPASPFEGPPTPRGMGAGWGAFNSPGFHAGEAGSPFAGPRTPIQVNSTTTVVLDGEKVGSIVERRIFANAGVYNSGFSSDDSSHHQ